MAYTKTSDSIIVKATLTEKGKKLLSRGKFKVAKFCLGDDEIDYRMFNSVYKDDLDYVPALENTEFFEALKDGKKNIQFGLNSYDSAVLYLEEEQLEKISPNIHAFIKYIPQLVINDKLTYSPTLRNDRYYLSVNDETTKVINEGTSGFKFLQTNNLDLRKIVVESGIINPSTGPGDGLLPSMENREALIVKKFLLDKDFIVYADNRFILTIASILPTSKFENFASGETIVNLHTAPESVAISLDNEFEYFATYPIPTIANHMANYGLVSEEAVVSLSALKGPRGSISAINPIVDNELKVNSTGERDARFSIYGTLDDVTFSELPNSKFDYIDTTIYVIGVTTNSRLQIPIRIIRYSGT